MPRSRSSHKVRPRFRLTYANVVSTLCLFVLLGGGAYAAADVHLAKHSVGPRQLKKGAVTAAKLRKGAVTTAKLRKGAVTGAKIDLATLGTVPSAVRAASAVRADSAARADRATEADRVTEAAHAAGADRARSATHAGSADRASAALTADDAEQLGGHPAADYQLRVQGVCFNGAIEAIGPEGGVFCREAIRQISMDQSAGDPVSAMQLGPGLLLQSVCHDGGQVKVVFFNDGGIAASLNWFASVGGTVSADGAFIPANGSKVFLFNGSRVEGQFVYSIGVKLATVSLHALDAGTRCEVRGTALVVSPEGR